MTDNKRKISVTLSPDSIGLLDDYAMLLNVSRSKMLDDVLEMTLPTLRPFVDGMVMAKRHGKITHEVVDLIAQSQGALADLMSEMPGE